MTARRDALDLRDRSKTSMARLSLRHPKEATGWDQAVIPARNWRLPFRLVAFVRHGLGRR